MRDKTDQQPLLNIAVRLPRRWGNKVSLFGVTMSYTRETPGESQRRREVPREEAAEIGLQGRAEELASRQGIRRHSKCKSTEERRAQLDARKPAGTAAMKGSKAAMRERAGQAGAGTRGLKGESHLEKKGEIKSEEASNAGINRCWLAMITSVKNVRAAGKEVSLQ